MKPLPAALRFYHDHRMDRTARNNWFGLQGMFLTTDPRDAKRGLPHGRYDIPLVVTDRSFTHDNRLTNPFRQHGRAMANARRCRAMRESCRPGTARSATQVLVNGRFAPYKKVQPGRYRLQILNSSLFSSYDFALSDGRPFTQIGTGSGLLPHPVMRQDILLGPAQRADVVVDFRGRAARTCCCPRSRAPTAPPTAPAAATAALMQFRVRGTTAPEGAGPVQPGRHLGTSRSRGRSP